MTIDPANVPEVKIGDWLREGWEVFVSDIGMFILAGVIYTVLNAVCFPILFGPLTCGMYLMFSDRMKGKPADIKRLFEGFNFFGQSLLAGVIFFLLTIVGWVATHILFAACVIPALIGIAVLVLLQTVFLFTFQLIALQGMDAMDAISNSFNKVKENLWEFLIFGFIIWIISYAGYSLVVGWLITTPLILAATAVAYRDVYGLEGSLIEAQTEGN